MRLVDLGRLGYAPALAAQRAHHVQVSAGGPDRLLLVEHPPVVTLGRRGGEDFLDRQALAAKGVQVVQTRRGGLVTCHFPGQLVVYVIFRVPRFSGGLRAIVHALEEAAIRTAAHFGVAAGRRPAYPGVWVDQNQPGKLASVGLAVRRMTTLHGLALNVGPDVSLFNYITPCGLAGVRATSLSLAGGRNIAFSEAKHVFAGFFAEQAEARLAHSALV